MIYNLVNYLKTELPAYNFSANGEQNNTPNDAIIISESTGDPNPQFDRNDFVFQFLSRSDSKTTARKQIIDIYDKIQKKFGIELPAVNVDSVNYPAVKTWKIVALALPGFIGNDENGRAEFSINFLITTE